METQTTSKENLAFTKSAMKMGFDALSAFTSQAAIASDIVLGATPVPEEGKRAVSLFFREGQKGLDNLKTHMERSLDVDWTAKDAPVKNLDAMETFCRDAFSQVDNLKNETQMLIEKATKPLPREAKFLVDSWNDSVNSGLEFFQSCMNRNFDIARRALTGVSMFTPGAAAEAMESMGEPERQ